jgi:hypothetical protein
MVPAILRLVGKQLMDLKADDRRVPSEPTVADLVGGWMQLTDKGLRLLERAVAKAE